MKDDYQRRLVIAGCERRLSEIGAELAEIVRVSPEMRLLAVRTLRPHLSTTGRQVGRPKKDRTVKLVDDLQEARARRASHAPAVAAAAPKPPRQKKRKPMTAEARERLRRAMTARWKAAKKAGRTLTDGFTNADALRATSTHPTPPPTNKRKPMSQQAKDNIRAGRLKTIAARAAQRVVPVDIDRTEPQSIAQTA